ncbi:sulfotransferase domain-containing protein [Luteolibacter marinus]|uniref:sulfotransferase domain-containing protein n=1 Tax=Luteolibacter marinus TaxID=2776705 RepID=UPI0018663B92|nr:sulfotransferase domain-containing protein [Luteolibacter marinus]
MKYIGDKNGLSLYARVENKIRFNIRKATWRLRSDPSFLIVGVQKGGTSSLHKYLVQHPSIAQAVIKEVHFFDGGLDPSWNKWEDGMKLYKSYMPLRMRSKGMQIFDASPDYIYHPEAARRIFGIYPKIKLVILLRDPVERAISHYFHEVRRGRETLSLMAALEAEETRVDPSYRAQDFKRREWNCFSYKRKGLYAQQIREYFKYFDRDSILIKESEELFENPGKIVGEVCSFIGVKSEDLRLDFSPKGVGTNRLESSEVDSARKMLRDIYREPNRDLEELLKMKFSWVMD